MRFPLTRVAIACLASLALATSANAANILQFQQVSNVDAVVASNPGGSTTTTTLTTSPATGIPVTIISIGTITGLTIQATEIFSVPPTSSTAATNVSGNISQSGYNGTIQLIGTPGTPFAGQNILTTTFTNATLSGQTGGNSGTLNGSQPPNTVVFTSANPIVIAALGGTTATGAFSLAFSNLTSTGGDGLSINGNTVAAFTAQNTGTFSTSVVIPEPTSIVLAGMSVLAGLGCHGWRRLRASRA